jgi:hypothetical protein
MIYLDAIIDFDFVMISNNNGHGVFDSILFAF